MNKKISKAIIVVGLIFMIAFSLFACNSHYHSYTEKNPYVPGATKKEATCTEKGICFYVCSCGAIGEETYEVGNLYHDFSKEIEDDAHFASSATCTTPKTYYYSCTLCDTISDSLTFTSGECLSHEYKNNLCIFGCGKEFNVYTLSDNGEYYTLSIFKEDVKTAIIPAQYKGLPVKAIGENAFASVKVSEVVLPETVTEICDRAFFSHEYLEKINLESVVTIGNYAFDNCKLLADINISSAETLGEYAFSATALTEVTIPESVTSIGRGAFSSCKSLARVNYLARNSADLTYPDSAFASYNDESPYISLYIGEAVTRIPNSLFCNARIGSLEFAQGSVCREIGECAFYSVTGLENLVLDTIETVGKNAFANSSITELTLGGLINTVGERAFSCCDSLTKVTISANRGGFGRNIFLNSANLHDIYYLHEGTETIGEAFGSLNGLNIIFGKNVKTIPENFDQSGTIETITFEQGSEGVRIGRYAFLSQIKGELDLSSVVSIGACAFYRTTDELTKVTLGRELESIGTYAFSSLGEVVFLAVECNDVTATEEGDRNTGAIINAKKVTIGKDVKKIPANLFELATNITEVKFYATNASDLESGIFANHTNAKGFRLVIGEDVTHIPDYSFSRSPVSSIVFEGESQCLTIGNNAFSRTYYLQGHNVVLPNSVETVEDNAFFLTKADSITFGTGIKYIGENALCAMAITGVTDYGFINAVYFTGDMSFTATKLEDSSSETLSFVADADEETAHEYAKLFFKKGYTYTLTESNPS